MSTPYCEKHEWPAGMDKPCPDCAEVSALLAEVERLKDKYETCEQCDGSTDAGVFCIPCWNALGMKASAKNDLREALAKSDLQIGDLKAKMESVNKTLVHLGLEPLQDGRSVTDGLRPWEQHISMILASLALTRGPIVSVIEKQECDGKACGCHTVLSMTVGKCRRCGCGG